MLLSFYFSHQISSVEGGMICCKNKQDEDIIKSLRSHGWTKDLSNQRKIEKKYKYINKNFFFINSGFNFRPTDIQSAIGLSQFKSLNNFIKIRKLNRNNMIKKIMKEKRWNNQVSYVENKDNSFSKKEIVLSIFSFILSESIQRLLTNSTKFSNTSYSIKHWIFVV